MRVVEYLGLLEENVAHERCARAVGHAHGTGQQVRVSHPSAPLVGEERVLGGGLGIGGRERGMVGFRGRGRVRVRAGVTHLREQAADHGAQDIANAAGGLQQREGLGGERVMGRVRVEGGVRGG